ncbi:MAG TPA: GYF domain-containing protein, partial [Polyangiaceae bacterium]|nr:GYF domain-containing protein [Polyangiaceae bacterium]
MRWFVDITSWEPIAMDMRQLVRAFDAGRIDADTLVWRKGMPDWRRLRDISELAERLVGNGDTADKSASEAPPADLGQSSSEPPPRQSERSRTPPASYTVGSRSGSEPPAATPDAAPQGSLQPGATLGTSLSSMPPPPDAETPVERTSVAAASPSDIPPPSRRSTASGAPRAHSRRGRGKTPSRPNAAPAPVPSRTVTQTGLESPAEVTARNSITPPAPVAVPAEVAATRSRDSRTGGSRRQSSSDETPAQKPSSLSVPPGALETSPVRGRGRRYLALAAVVLGGIILVKQVATSGDGASATAAHRVDAVSEPKHVESTHVEPAPSA